MNFSDVSSNKQKEKIEETERRCGKSINYLIAAIKNLEESKTRSLTAQNSQVEANKSLSAVEEVTGNEKNSQLKHLKRSKKNYTIELKKLIIQSEN
ncbi:MAG: hypothetical protein LBJ32_02135 [Oscillospiraceae bacterium]|jgi:hypothetical protein|nr:hypothetical protein [Oscillospiraceae bacterium]